MKKTTKPFTISLISAFSCIILLANGIIASSNNGEVTANKTNFESSGYEISPYATHTISQIPEIITLGSTKNFTLSLTEERLYKFSSNQSHSLRLNLNVPQNIGITVYDENYSILAETDGGNLNFLYEAGETIYINVRNLTYGTQNVSLELLEADTISTNSAFAVSVPAYTTAYYPFDFFAVGEYELTTGSEYVTAQIVGSNGLAVNHISNDGGEYFIKLTNPKSWDISINLLAEFSPAQAVFGNNAVTSASGFVAFDNLYDNTYKFTGVTEIYDYSLNPISITNGKAFLQGQKTYYFKHENTTSVEIAVDYADAELEKNVSLTSDSHGYSYFKITVPFSTTYSFEANGQILLFNSELAQPASYTSGEEIKLSKGTHDIQVYDSTNTTINMKAILNGYNLQMYSENVLSNNGTALFKFIPNMTASYRLYTTGDLNATLNSRIIIYGTNSSGELVQLTEMAENVKYDTKNVTLQKDSVYFITVQRTNASGQAVIFSCEYTDSNIQIQDETDVKLEENLSKLKTIPAGEFITASFSPKTSGTYNFYILDKETSSIFTVQLYENNNSSAKEIKPEIIYDEFDTCERYSLSLTKGATYFFVIKYQGSISEESVMLHISKTYSKIGLKAATVNSNNYNYDSPLTIYPGMSYHFSLFGDETFLTDNLDINISGSPYYTFDSETGILTIQAPQSFGGTISVDAEYLRKFYSLTLLIENPINSVSSSVELTFNDSGYAVPEIQTEIVFKNDAKLHATSINVQYEFYSENSLIGSFSHKMLSQSKTRHTYNYPILEHIRKNANKVVCTISYNINGVICSMTYDIEYTSSSTTLTPATTSPVEQSVDTLIARVLGADSDTEYYNTVIVSPNVMVLYLEGIRYANYSKLNFVIENRTAPILIYVKNFIFSSSTDTIAINANGATVYLHYEGTVKITGGDGKNGISENPNGSDGQVAVLAETLYVYGELTSYIDIIGGDGGSGKAGTNGANGSDGEDGNNTFGQQAAHGQNGGNGYVGSHGGSGGDGAPAISANTVFFNGGYNGYTNIEAGVGGSGEDGGNGGNGGGGGEGADTYSRSDGSSDAGVGGNGGAGGQGGNAGDGGNGSSAIDANSITNHSYNLIIFASYGGLGGDGGNGGHGGNGGGGGDDTQISGSEADGGDGGNGGHGGNAGDNGILGTEVTLNSSSTATATQHVLPDNIRGGYYGAGGIGGNGGNAGDDGGYSGEATNGSDGINGNNGQGDAP